MMVLPPYFLLSSAHSSITSYTGLKSLSSGQQTRISIPNKAQALIRSYVTLFIQSPEYVILRPSKLPLISLIVMKSQTIYNGWAQSSRALMHGTDENLANSSIIARVGSLALQTSTILDITSAVSSTVSLTPSGAN